MCVFVCVPLDLFDNYMQQDAHEFLNYLLNTVADILQEEKKQEKQNGRLKNNGTPANAPSDNAPSNDHEHKVAEATWVHDIFQGTLTNETRCLNCETVRRRLRACACVCCMHSIFQRCGFGWMGEGG